jgi:hypothetical protein
MTLPIGKDLAKMPASWSESLRSNITVDPEAAAKFTTNIAQSSELHPSFSACTVNFSTTRSNVR